MQEGHSATVNQIGTFVLMVMVVMIVVVVELLRFLRSDCRNGSMVRKWRGVFAYMGILLIENRIVQL